VPRARAELNEVRVGDPLMISVAPFFIAEHEGYYREQGCRA
jgi:hypothetical protein